MGVFARFLRKSKDAEGAKDVPAEGKTADTLAVEPEAGKVSETGASKKDAPAESADKAAETPEAGKAEEAEAAAVTEGVEIPRQQSAGEAADREAGEGARK